MKASATLAALLAAATLSSASTTIPSRADLKPRYDLAISLTSTIPYDLRLQEASSRLIQAIGKGIGQPVDDVFHELGLRSCGSRLLSSTEGSTKMLFAGPVSCQDLLGRGNYYPGISDECYYAQITPLLGSPVPERKFIFRGDGSLASWLPVPERIDLWDLDRWFDSYCIHLESMAQRYHRIE